MIFYVHAFVCSDTYPAEYWQHFDQARRDHFHLSVQIDAKGASWEFGVSIAYNPLVLAEQRGS